MPLPALDDRGYLPAGIHHCDWEEFVQRFGGGSPEREVGIRELEECLQWALRAGVRRLLVDGSFVTSKESPNDVDVAILPGPDYPRSEKPAEDLVGSWPYVHVQVAADEADLKIWASLLFGLDRKYQPRGIVEMII